MKGTEKEDVGRTNGCQVYRKGISKQRRPQRWDSYMVCNKKMTVLKGGWMYASLFVTPVNDTEVLLVSVPDFEYPKL